MKVAVAVYQGQGRWGDIKAKKQLFLS
jgi:hypothetical protein